MRRTSSAGCISCSNRAGVPIAQSRGWGARTERTTRRAYSVDNRHKTGITLQVLHAAPVSRNEKIEVESRYQPQPTDTAWNRTPGTVAWQQLLAAGATARFSAEHTIRYPKDITLQEKR